NHFMNINPLGCENCSAKGSIKTPLEIGKKYRNENILVPDTHDDKNGAALPGHSEYVLKDGALYFAHDNPNGAPTYTKISSYQVKIQSLHVGEVKNNQNYVLLRHYKPHTGWHEAELKASELLGDKTVAIMADLGSVIHDRIHFQMYVRDSIDYLRQKQKEEMQYEQFGWKNSNKSFLYGDTLYSSNSIATTAINQDLRFRAQWLCPVAGGSVEKWKDAVDCLFGRGSEGMSFTILASFASVLMRFLEENEGGAIVSLMTRHSGAGKTTTLSGAYTVWASNMHALGLTTIDTKVAKSLSLGALGNLPAFYDEFTDKDPEVIKNFIEMFTNGRDKKRGTSSGELQNSLLTWQMLLISAGNQSLVDTIRSTGKSEAPSMRILEFGVESSGDMLQSRLMALAKQLHANAGHAGAEYLKYLIQPGTLEVIYYQLPRIIDEIMKNCSFQKQHRFW
ncbi:MAG: DUF927 domain-containing protein, partial [Thaumarchaeota archaeon]|nr:DUF927 domain-containing protein [Nitrososphaerota archaeon]